MSTGPVPRALAAAEATFLGSFSGRAWVALVAAGLVYPAVVLAIAAAAIPGIDLLATAEQLFSALFLPVVLLLVCLINGVALFRGEIEEGTAIYPLGRTVPRPALVAGKYLGFAGATLLVLLPSTVLGTGLAAALGSGPTVASSGLLEAVAGLTVLGTLCYGAVFLLLGLLTRQALLLGLLYGFIWETFISQLPGPIHELTVVYYLRGIATQLVLAGPLGAGPTGVTIAGGTAGILGTVVAALVLAALWLRYAEMPTA